jgi:hypothetical protein
MGITGKTDAMRDPHRGWAKWNTTKFQLQVVAKIAGGFKTADVGQYHSNQQTIPRSR